MNDPISPTAIGLRPSRPATPPPSRGGIFKLLLVALLGGGLFFVFQSRPINRAIAPAAASPTPSITPAMPEVIPAVPKLTPALPKTAPEPAAPPPTAAATESEAETARIQARVRARIESVQAIEGVRPLMARRNFADAAKALGAWLAERPAHPQRALVEHQITRLRAAEQATPALLAQASALAGAQIPVGNTVWPVASLTNGHLICRVNTQFGIIERPLELSALSEAALLILLQRADASAKTTFTPAYLLGTGKSAEARAALRGTTPKVEAMRADLAEFDQVAGDGAVLAELQAVENLLAGQDPGQAQERLAQCEKAYPTHEFLTIAYADKISAWQKQLASAPTPAKPPAPTVNASETYPGLATLTLSGSAAPDSDRKRLLLAAQWAISTGKWDIHFAQLKSALAAAAGLGPRTQHPQNLECLINPGTPALVTEQARFIRAVGPATLTTFCATVKSPEFLTWLFERQSVLAAFNDTIQAQDKAGDALLAWHTIWNADKDNRESLANLAIACALVFDQPVPISPDVYGFAKKTESSSSSAGDTTYEVSAIRRYRFYRDSAKKGSLKVPINEMTPWELVWVVDAPVPESELVWAQKHANFSRRDWGKAYGHIRYRMDRATQGVNPYKAYTFAEIESEGGICGDQAYFAAMTAKANGIPAMVISGEGDRGGHAWMGYELGRNEWKLDTGRYADHFAAGTTREPQTGRIIKEQELRQLTDPARRTPAYEKSNKLLALATLFTDSTQRTLGTLAANAALVAAPKNFAAWSTKLDLLAEAKAPCEEWLKESTRMRTTFREFPDLVQVINKREADYTTANVSSEAARKLVHIQTARMERMDADRSDLIVESVFREVELAEKAGDEEKAGRVFRDALRAKGQEIVPFKKIATSYYAWAAAKDKGGETARELISFFDRKFKEPTDDVFAISAYTDTLTKLSEMAKAQGLETQQRHLERRAEKLKELKEKLGKQQSRGADR